MIIYCPQPPNRYTENLPTKKYVGRRRDDASGTEGCDGWRSVPTEVHVKLPRAMERRHAASVSAAACTGSYRPAAYVGRRRDDASGTEGCDGWRSVPTEVHVKLPRAMERRHAASVSAAACTGSDHPAGVQRVFQQRHAASLISQRRRSGSD